MFRFEILGSSSSGNCAFLEIESGKYLIDAGFTGKRICEMLENINESIDNIDGIFLTHEHQDHAQGLRGLARKKKNLTVFATEGTAREVHLKYGSAIDWRIFCSGDKFVERSLEIEAFRIPHDASDPVGFRFDWGEPSLFSPQTSLAWVTDLGHVPQLVKEKIRTAHILAFESNYDPSLLEEDQTRPWHVKQRAMSRHGHLSNQAALDALLSIEKPHWQEIHLVHLSQRCNSISHIEKVFQKQTLNLSKGLFIFNPTASRAEALSIS